MDSSQLKQLGTILGIWAHPDDESFMMAGVMASAVANGQTVACITATKGEKGLQDATKWSLDSLGAVRQAELEQGLRILGISNHHWLGFMDGECDLVNETEAVKTILSYIEQYQPDTIITFPPDGLTGHPDHVAVSGWAKQAVEQYTKPIQLLYGVDTREKYEKFLKPIDEQINVYFNIDEPCLVAEADCDITFRLPTELAKLKYEALLAMPSQTEGMMQSFDRDFLESCFSSESFVRAERAITWGTPKAH